MTINYLESSPKLGASINPLGTKQIPAVKSVSSSTEAPETLETVTITHDLTPPFEPIKHKIAKLKRHIVMDDFDSESESNQFMNRSSSGKCAFLASMANYICSCLSSTKEKIDDVIVKTRQEAITYIPLEVTVNNEAQLDSQNSKLMPSKLKESLPSIKFKQKCILPGYNLTKNTIANITLFADSHIQAADLNEDLLQTFSEPDQIKIVEYYTSKNTSPSAWVIIIIDSKPLDLYNETLLGTNEIEPTDENIILLKKKHVCNLRLKYN